MTHHMVLFGGMLLFGLGAMILGSECSTETKTAAIMTGSALICFGLAVIMLAP